MAAGPQNRTVGSDRNVSGPSVVAKSPVFDPLKSGMHDHFLKHDGPILEAVKDPKEKPKGSGYFDVSRQAFGPGSSPKNSFGNLRDEEECFDAEVGMWEHEIEVVKEFVETSTRPKIEDYNAWSEKMKKYFDGLTKMNGDEVKVESKTDETARFMKIGTKF
ncbi:hypothetical protein HanIR_Chr10g0479641 [Helianthus annuus]|nr:hypothetical protein HanIR_Chr10g0479641 [Helianthus annuus]KAJ0530245.1 hypothetical protein HanHA89_Chr10g0387421 [Helianthus annuus]